MSYNPRDWKAGDIALVTHARLGTRVGMRRHRDCFWAFGTTSWPDWNITDARRLVVIDPEDREQVERLADIFCKAPSSGWVHDMQAALREFANPKPPKPAEPKGLGAVVRDSEGRLWLRDGLDYSPGQWWGMNGARRAWDRIDVAEVLSEGVSL